VIPIFIGRRFDVREVGIEYTVTVLSGQDSLKAVAAVPSAKCQTTTQNVSNSIIFLITFIFPV
jgi:hypothetical protein